MGALPIAIASDARLRAFKLHARADASAWRGRAAEAAAAAALTQSRKPRAGGSLARSARWTRDVPCQRPIKIARQLEIMIAGSRTVTGIRVIPDRRRRAVKVVGGSLGGTRGKGADSDEPEP